MNLSVLFDVLMFEHYSFANSKHDLLSSTQRSLSMILIVSVPFMLILTHELYLLLSKEYFGVFMPHLKQIILIKQIWDCIYQQLDQFIVSSQLFQFVFNEVKFDLMIRFVMIVFITSEHKIIVREVILYLSVMNLISFIEIIMSVIMQLIMQMWIN